MNIDDLLAERRRERLQDGEQEPDVHLVVGPREYIGLQSQAWIACDRDGDRVRVPLDERTRDASRATCLDCLAAVS
jgi:hypothetical protein